MNMMIDIDYYLARLTNYLFLPATLLVYPRYNAGAHPGHLHCHEKNMNFGGIIVKQLLDIQWARPQPPPLPTSNLPSMNKKLSYTFTTTPSYSYVDLLATDVPSGPTTQTQPLIPKIGTPSAAPSRVED